MKKRFCFISIFQIAICLSQQAYEIEAQVDPINGIIKVNQLFSYTNNSSKALDTLYLYDWNHAYSDTSTPLAAKLAQEFNFQFEYELLQFAPRKSGCGNRLAGTGATALGADHCRLL